MAALIGGDFVEAYVLKNAYKEKLRRMEAAEEKKSKGVPVEKKASVGGSKRGGLLGLIKKKVHPKAPAETSNGGGKTSSS